MCGIVTWDNDRNQFFCDWEPGGTEGPVPALGSGGRKLFLPVCKRTDRIWRVQGQTADGLSFPVFYVFPVRRRASLSSGEGSGALEAARLGVLFGAVFSFSVSVPLSGSFGKKRGRLPARGKAVPAGNGRDFRVSLSENRDGIGASGVVCDMQRLHVPGGAAV